MLKLLASTAVALAMSVSLSSAQDKELKSVGVTLGPLGNPFYVALAKGMETEIAKLAPNAEVTVVSHDYDLNKEVTAVETFIAAGTDIIFINAADSEAIEPTVKTAAPGSIRSVGSGSNMSKRRATTSRPSTSPSRPTTRCEAVAQSRPTRRAEGSRRARSTRLCPGPQPNS